jgi:hypothetical protein
MNRRTRKIPLPPYEVQGTVIPVRGNAAPASLCFSPCSPCFRTATSGKVVLILEPDTF